ncbi:MAG TPA: 50S ribosomal protein L11 methyltransferase [Roseiarcus sp.]|jgi:ribosomal protein L11 methyltransferase
MLEGLPPNNAAHRMRLVSDERRARAVADLIVESFESAEAAATAFETDDPWPGGGKAWLMEAYFGSEPDEAAIRALTAAASDEATAASATFGLTEKRDWVANSLAGLKPVRAGRFLVHGSHDRARVKVNDIAIEIEAGLAFGTGHHGTTRGCLLHFDRLLRRRRNFSRTGRVLDVGCGAGVLAIAATKILRRKVWLGDIDPVAVSVANANARLNGVGAFCQAVVSRGVESARLREGAPYDLVFANILARPLRLLAPSLASVMEPDGDAIVSGLLLADVAGVLASWRAQGLHLAERIDLDGWASLRLRR